MHRKANVCAKFGGRLPSTANKIASAVQEVRESNFLVRLKAKRFSHQVQRHH